MLTGTEENVSQKSKGLSSESLLLLLLLITVFSPQLNVTEIQIFCLVLKGSCLKKYRATFTPQQDKATFTPPNVIAYFIIYELDAQKLDLHADSALNDCFFGGVKITKNSDLEEYSCFGYGIGLDSRF